MGVRDIAEKNILKNKLNAERVADLNLNNVLKDENVKILFVKCKRLVVDIAKCDVAGKNSAELRKEYNETRELLAKVLKEMGVEKSELRPNYACSQCKDTGYINGIECECLKKEISKELIKASGIDISNLPKFDNDYSIFDNSREVEHIYSLMKKFVLEINKTQIDTVVILGNTGVGKTHLIGCMTNFALEKGMTIKFTTAFNFNQDMLKYHCSKLEEKGEILDNYVNSELLFIDDLGSENKINNVTNEYLYMVINERMQHHKKTIITTNLDFAQIQDSYGERIFSRLMHKKHSLKISFPGCDLRIKQSSK